MAVALGQCASCGCWNRRVANSLARRHPPASAAAVFVVTEEDAAGIRAVFERAGDFSAAFELRQRFPGSRQYLKLHPLRPSHATQRRARSLT